MGALLPANQMVFGSARLRSLAKLGRTWRTETAAGVTHPKRCPKNAALSGELSVSPNYVTCFGHDDRDPNQALPTFFDRPVYDLVSARPGSFALVSSAEMIDPLLRDYDNTTAMIFGMPPTFDAIHESLLAIETGINRTPKK